MSAVSYPQNLSPEQLGCLCWGLNDCAGLKLQTSGLGSGPSVCDVEVIGMACSNALQKMYGEESRLGRAVFMRNPIQQFIHVVERVRLLFRQIQWERFSTSVVNQHKRCLADATYLQMSQGSMQERAKSFSRYSVLLKFLSNPALEKTFNHLSESENFGASLSHYILHSASPFVSPHYFEEVTSVNDLQARFDYTTNCLMTAVECGDYEALELGVLTLRVLYETRGDMALPPIPHLLGSLLLQALWNRDLAVAVRLIQLGASLHIKQYLDVSQAESLGHPELAGTYQKASQFVSYLYSSEEPIVSLIREAAARQESQASSS